MSVIYPESDVQLISDKLFSGSVGVMPSDTVYGIFALALNPTSVERIYSIKKRDLDKPFIVLVSDIKELELFGIKPSVYAKGVLDKYWPGPLSVIFDCDDYRFEYLHRGSKTLAIRFPNDEWLLSIIRKTGPLVAPSANLQGDPTVENAAEAVRIFGDSVDFYVDGSVNSKAPSTLVRINDHGVEVLRQGSLELI